MTPECAYDGDDCDECVALGVDVSLLGDGHCDGGLYLSVECNNDAGDCVWKQLGDDVEGESSDDRSGSSVSMSSDGTRVAIGAYGNDGGGDYAGHVRVYSLN